MLAFIGSILWGLQYAIWGHKLKNVSASLSLVYYFLGCTVLFGIAHIVMAKKSDTWAMSGNETKWMILSIVLGTVANFLIRLSILQKSASLTSLIEISYPLFVVLFSWILFKDATLSLRTLVGGGIIMLGVIIVSTGK